MSTGMETGTGMEWRQGSAGMFSGIAGALPSWFGWTLALLGIAFALAWAFAGNRRFLFIARVQSALIGASAGSLLGMLLPTLLQVKPAAASSLASAPVIPSFGLAEIAGAIVLGVLFTLTGRFWARLLFFLGGTGVGGVLTLFVMRLFHLSVAHPLPPVLVLSLLFGLLTLWLSLRFPAPFAGIWGGFCFAAAGTWPMLQLFEHVGGPVWLPYLASGGLGILVGIAGTALQIDKEAERQSLREYRQEVAS